jgi:hypothetical protein
MDKDDLRFVAHVDILGMSALVERDADEAWGMLSDLVAVRDRVAGLAFEFLDTKEIVAASEATQRVTFSDTIVLFTNGTSDTELRCLIILLTELLHKAMFRCVPVRIGLAVGRFFCNTDKSMYAGPALIEAYRVGESAQWLGVSLAKSVADRARSLGMKTGRSDVIVQWLVPVKSGTEQRFVVNWPAVFAHDFKVHPPISVAQFYQAFEHAFGPFSELPHDVQAKYENTVRFINTQLALHARA